MSATIYSLDPDETGPSFYDHLNPKLPHAERFAAQRLLDQPEVQITERVFDYFLGVLPPVFWRRNDYGESFCISEATTHHNGRVITSEFIRRGDEYFHHYTAIDQGAWYQECD